MGEQASNPRQRKRLWLFGLLLIFLVNCVALPGVLDKDNLWTDSENHDTRTLLRETRKQEDTLRWFVHDWPLGNGFYRPIPTMLFIADDELYHNNLNYYRLTNWFIGVACALLLAWWVFELFGTVVGALGSALIFSAWQSGLAGMIPFSSTVYYFAGMALVLPLVSRVFGFSFGIVASGVAVTAFGQAMSWFLDAEQALSMFVFALVFGGVCWLLARSKVLWQSLAAAGTVAFLWRELSCWLERMDIVQATFSFRNIEWPPGRTATIMALFALVCMAAYCRFERVRRARWALLCLVGLLLAFLSYEQAVVIPPALLACALALHLQKVKVRWSFHLAPWAMAAVYVVLHKTFLHDTRYRKQAYRGTTGGWRDLAVWIFPSSFETRYMSSFFGSDIGMMFVFIPTLWEYLANILSNLMSYIEARKAWMPCAFGLLGSVGTFVPMAFQHPLAHYYYFPMMFRSIFVAWLMMLTWRAIVSVASHQTSQVPGTLSLELRWPRHR